MPQIMPPWEEMEDYFRQRYPERSVQDMRREYEMERARRRAARDTQGEWEGSNIPLAIARRIPFASIPLGLAEGYAHGDASQRVRDGSATSADYLTVAERQRSDQLASQRTWGETAANALTHIPTLVGEAAVGGLLFRGAGAAGSAAAPALGEAVPLLSSAGIRAVFSNVGSGIGRAAGTQGGRAMASAWGGNAARTLAMPSLYVDNWTSRAAQAGRNPLSIDSISQDLPPAYALGFMQNAVLGSLGTAGNSIPGAGVRAATQRLGVRTVTGMAEQQAVDILGGVVDEALPEAYQLRTRYGLIGNIARGEYGEAFGHAGIQALTFAAFSALHPVIHGEPQAEYSRAVAERMRPFQGYVDSMARQHISRDAAARRANAILDHVVEGLQANPEMTREQAQQRVAELNLTGPALEFARSLTDALPPRPYGPAELGGQGRQTSLSDMARPVTPGQEPAAQPLRERVQGIIAEAPPQEAPVPQQPQVQPQSRGVGSVDARLAEMFPGLANVEVPVKNPSELAPRAPGSEVPRGARGTAEPLTSNPRLQEVFDRMERGETIVRDDIAQAMKATNKQLEAFMEVAVNRRTLEDIASERGVAKQAISELWTKAYKKAGITKEKATELLARIEEENRTARELFEGSRNVDYVPPTSGNKKAAGNLLSDMTRIDIRMNELAAEYEREGNRKKPRQDKLDEITKQIDALNQQFKELFKATTRESGEAGTEGVLYGPSGRIQLSSIREGIARLERFLRGPEPQQAVPQGPSLRDRLSNIIQESENPAVLNAPPPGPQPQMSGTPIAINPYEFRATALALANEAGYVSKVPGKEAAAYLTRSQQLVQSGEMLAETPITIHEIAHGISVKNKLTFAALALNIRRGLHQFDYNPGRGMNNVSYQEGFAEWLRMRVTGQLNQNTMTVDQKAAAAWAEQRLASTGAAKIVERLAQLYQGMQSQSLAQQAQGMVSPSGQPAQPAGLTAMEGISRTMGTARSETQRLLENRNLPAEQLTAERERIGMPKLQEGERLSDVLEITQHLTERWESDIAAKGVIALEMVNGQRTPRVISESPMRIVEDLTQDLLRANGTSMRDALAKFAGIPVHESSSWFGTFILAKNTIGKVDRGLAQMQSPDPKVAAEGQRNVAAISAPQVEKFRAFLNDVRVNNPALYAIAERNYKRYTEFTDALLEADVIEGRITAGQANAYRLAEPDYVSLARVMENAGYEVVLGKRRRGSGRQLVDPMLTLRDLIELRAAKIAKTLKDEALIREGYQGQNAPVGVSNMFREIPMPKELEQVRIDVERRLDPNLPAAVKQAILNQIGVEFDVHRPWKDDTRNVYVAVVDGKPRVLEFYSRPLYNLVVGNTGLKSDYLVVRTAAHIAKLPGVKQLTESLKTAATSFNMIFNIRNPVRDPSAYSQNVMGQGRGFATDVWNFLRGHGQAFYQKSRKLVGVKETDATYSLYESLGPEYLRGPLSFASVGEGERAWRVIHGEEGTIKDKAIKGVEKLKDLLEMIGAGEHGPRFADFRNAMEERGWTEADIARMMNTGVNDIPMKDVIFGLMRASRATVQFPRQGELTHELNKFWPFLTSQIAGLSQESRNWAKAVKEMSQGKFGPKSKAMVGTLAAYIGLELLHHFIYRNEDWYNEQLPHQRYGWWLLGKREDGSTWGIPKPYGIMRMFGAYVQEALRVPQGTQQFGMATHDVAVEQLLPRSPFGVGEALQVAGNRDWRGMPIVPRQAEREETNFEQWMRYRIPYLADQLSGGLFSARIIRPPWEAFTSSRGEPSLSLDHYYERLQELERGRNMAMRMMVPFDREAEYQALHSVERTISMLGQQSRGEIRLGGRIIQNERPSLTQIAEIRRRQLELARNALRNSRQVSSANR